MKKRAIIMAGLMALIAMAFTRVAHAQEPSMVSPSLENRIAQVAKIQTQGQLTLVAGLPCTTP